MANGQVACCASGQWRRASVPSSVAKGSGEAGVGRGGRGPIVTAGLGMESARGQGGRAGGR